MNMNKFKESEYYMSKEHITNFENGRIIGNEKVKKLKKERIDAYDINPKLCINCESPILYEKQRNKFCCKSCAATFNNKNRSDDFITEEFKEKQRSNAIKGFNKRKRDNGEISYYELEIKCPECGKPLSDKQKMRHSTYCSNSCGSIKKDVSDYEKIQKIKSYGKKIVEMSCVICGNKYDAVYRAPHKGQIKTKQTCSNECHSSLLSKNSKELMKTLIKNGKHKGWNSRNIESYPETFFKKVLENNNIKYEFNKIISKRSLGLDCDSNYFLDFFIENKNVDLEIDGAQHKLEERIESDDIRDTALINNGFVVYRIEWKNINTKKGKEYIKNEIDKFLEFIK